MLCLLESVAVIFLLLVILLPPAATDEGDIASSWSVTGEAKRMKWTLNHMVLTSSGHVCVAGTNYIYLLNGSLHEKFSNTTTSSSGQGEKEGNVNKLLFYDIATNKIVACANNGDCSVLDLLGDSAIMSYKPFYSRCSGFYQPVSFIVELRGGNKRVLFVADVGQTSANNGCVNNGIFWQTMTNVINGHQVFEGVSNSNRLKIDVGKGINPYIDRFINGFPVGEYLYFFMTIRKVPEESMSTRIAQLCNCDNCFKFGKTVHGRYTYADMELSCKNGSKAYNFLRAVHYLDQSDGNAVLIGVFTTNPDGGGDGSAVCLFQVERVKKQFVENIKDCYKKDKKLTNHYFKDSTCASIKANFSSSDEYFLCNEGELEVLKNIFGGEKLEETAVFVAQKKTVTALAVVHHRNTSKTSLFLGTDSGVILKVSYNGKIAKRYDKVILDKSSQILPDMYVDASSRFLYAMTDFEVFKVNIKKCGSRGSSCATCLEDPNCGWCWLHHRCSVAEDCPSKWLTDQCPAVDNTDPPAIPLLEETEVSLEVNIVPEVSNLTCRFEYEVNGVIRHSDTPVQHTAILQQRGRRESSDEDDEDDNDHVTTIAAPTSTTTAAPASTTTTAPGDTSLQCSTLLDIDGRRLGSLLVNLSVLHGNTSLFQTSLWYFHCPYFSSCSQCVSENWSCDWCIYDNKCINGTEKCLSGDILVQHQEGVPDNKCPLVNTTLFGQVFIPANETTAVTFAGQNFPEPRDGRFYQCKIQGQTDTINAKRHNNSAVVAYANLSAESYNANGTRVVGIQLLWGKKNDSYPVDSSEDLKVTLYECQLMTTMCDECWSYVDYTSFKCQWCEESGGHGQCMYHRTTQQCKTQEICPNPVITQVYPLSSHINGRPLIEITGNNLGHTFTKIQNAVKIGGVVCTAERDSYVPAHQIYCHVSPTGEERNANITIHIDDRDLVKFDEQFTFLVPIVTSIYPTIGPVSGGSNITIYGQNLTSGTDIIVMLGNMSCSGVTGDSSEVMCKSGKAAGPSLRPEVVSMTFDGADVVGDNVNFTYLVDPTITDMKPLKSFEGGGRNITITGTNLHAIQNPKMFAKDRLGHLINETCDVTNSTFMICKSPRKVSNNSTVRRRRTASPESATVTLGFCMDDVMSVQDLTNTNVSCTLRYYPNPVVMNLTKALKPGDDSVFLKIQGRRLTVAADKSDITVLVGSERCNITSLTDSEIVFQAPKEQPHKEETVRTEESKDGEKGQGQSPAALMAKEEDVPGTYSRVVVKIGYLDYEVGYVDYANEADEADDYIAIIAGITSGALVVCLVAVAIVVFMSRRRIKRAKEETEIVQKQKDNLEINVRTQAREAFAELQIEMTDLTSELQGGTVPFHDYNTYLYNVLFPGKTTHPVLCSAFIKKDNTAKGLEKLKDLLKNKSFLLMFIRALEKQSSFTIKDKSELASLLIVTNQDDMEYITSIMKVLLSGLVDRMVERQTPKLLLRRSEFVVEKLLGHWLNVCLHGYLKESAGSSLFILYKAIKVQVEKGPVDYITGCAKYTLSEDKLFTVKEKEFDPKPLTLNIVHHNLRDDQKRTVNCTVLDCDTVTQAKAKMLEVLYKDESHSQRPSVHSLVLELRQETGNSLVCLEDEDDTNERDGMWKRLNTLKHHKVPDGADMRLTININRDSTGSLSLLDIASPTSGTLVIGSIKKVVRTISGSNYWHLTRNNSDDDESNSKLPTDFFLPQLVNTKGTVQKYIDDFFEKMLDTIEDPPKVIKYLFDFLDDSADRHGITDTDVLHTWKCNSLLLRFWVNMMKNPEFMFDIQKPQIVDSCLSVLAQTLMDSCSTAELQLGKTSPSNKLLFAKDIPRYKEMVRKYFQFVKAAPAVTEQQMEDFLQKEVSQNVSQKFQSQNALLQIGKYAWEYRSQILSELESEKDKPDINELMSQDLRDTMDIIGEELAAQNNDR